MTVNFQLMFNEACLFKFCHWTLSCDVNIVKIYFKFTETLLKGTKHRSRFKWEVALPTNQTCTENSTVNDSIVRTEPTFIFTSRISFRSNEGLIIHCYSPLAPLCLQGYRKPVQSNNLQYLLASTDILLTSSKCGYWLSFQKSCKYGSKERY